MLKASKVLVSEDVVIILQDKEEISEALLLFNSKQDAGISCAHFVTGPYGKDRILCIIWG